MLGICTKFVISCCCTKLDALAYSYAFDLRPLAHSTSCRDRACSVAPFAPSNGCILCKLPCGSSKDCVLMRDVACVICMFSYCAGYLTSDGVMASKAQTMQSTIEYMNRKYGSAAGYVKVIGITPSEVSAIRLNMLIKAAPRDLLERLSFTGNVRGRGSLSPQSSRDHLSRRTYSSDGSHTPGSPTNDRFDTSLGSNKSTGPKNLTRRSKTFSTLSRRSRDQANGQQTATKQPHDIMINKKISDFN